MNQRVDMKRQLYFFVCLIRQVQLKLYEWIIRHDLSALPLIIRIFCSKYLRWAYFLPYDCIFEWLRCLPVVYPLTFLWDLHFLVKQKDPKEWELYLIKFVSTFIWLWYLTLPVCLPFQENLFCQNTSIIVVLVLACTSPINYRIIEALLTIIFQEMALLCHFISSPSQPLLWANVPNWNSTKDFKGKDFSRIFQ